nr:integrase, catalytic region, zinc finger, CCHC-type, peptidase aspartic, catalytic [Tanacetum cinerariifolium]
MKDVFEELEAEVAQYVVDRKHDAIELKNILIANDNLIAECLSQEVFCVATNSELNVARFTKMYVANTTTEARCLALEAELANLRDTNNHDNQKELMNHFSKLETINSQVTKLTDQVTHLQAQNDLFMAENDKIKQHYKELYDSIKITHAKHIEQVTKLTTKNMNLKTSVSKATVNSQVSARDKHAIDVEPIVPRLRNNKDAHLDYLWYLKESVETTRNIVEEAKLAYIPLIRKKQVNVAKPSDKLDSTTHRHAVTVKSQKTNVPVPPFTRVNSCPNASGSQPKSHVKSNRISPAKGVNKLPVEDQPRTNKSHLRTLNRVDSSSCSKHMTRDRSQLMNFVKKFIGTVRFRNDHFGSIMGYGDYVIGSRGSNLYTISIEDMMKSSPICLLSKAYKNKSWLWYRRLNHLNFGTINDLARKELVRGLPRLKFVKDHLCSTVPRTPQQNGVVERRNRTLVEAARTMLIFSKASMFLRAEAVATACYTQNRSLIHTRHHKTSYELVHNKKPNLIFFRVFGALCYPTNDNKDLGKLQPTANTGIFVGYAPSRKGYRIYNKRTRRIMETIHVQFNELTEHLVPVQLGTGPAPNFLTPGEISSCLVPNTVPATPSVPPTNKELEILFQPMFDEYLEPPRAERPVSPTQAEPAPVNSAGTPLSNTIDQDAPTVTPLFVTKTLCHNLGISSKHS